MAEKHVGWIAKDKDGEFWLGTFRVSEAAVKSYIKHLPKWKHLYEFKVVKVKYVEVK